MTGLFFLSAVAIGLYKSRDTLKGPQDVLKLIAAIGFVMALGLGANERRHGIGETYFRDQFHLPDGIEFVEMPRARHGLPARAVVAFSDADWHAFVADLNVRATPFLFTFPGNPDRHARIARWQDLPPVLTAADAPKHIMDIPRIYDFVWDYPPIRNGKVLCIVYVATTPDGARSCHDSTKDDPLYSFVLGILDLDTRQLYLRFKGDTGAWL